MADSSAPLHRAEKVSEPALHMGMITGLVAAIFGALVVFGVPVTPEQSAAVGTLVVAVAGLAPLVSAYLTRRKVVPVADLPAEVQDIL